MQSSLDNDRKLYNDCMHYLFFACVCLHDTLIQISESITSTFRLIGVGGAKGNALVEVSAFLARGEVPPQSR